VDESSKRESKWNRRGLGIAILTLVTWTVFLPSLGLPLLGSWNPDFWQLEQPRLALTFANLGYWLTHAASYGYLPVTTLTFMADGWCWHFSAWGMHLQSLLWHWLAVIGLYLVLRRLGTGAVPALLGALFWAIHPQRAEAVSWLVQRTEVVGGALYFWSILFYLKGPQWRLQSALLFLLGAAANPVGIFIPLALMAYEFYRLRRWDLPFFLRRVWLYLVIMAAFVPALWSRCRPEDALPWGRRLAVAAYNALFYLGKTLLPSDLNPFYASVLWDRATWAVMILGCGILLLLAVTLWRRQRSALIYQLLPAYFAYGVLVLPVCGLLPLEFVERADHNSYLPSVVVLLAVIGYLKTIWTGGTVWGGRMETILAEYYRRRRVFLLLLGIALLGMMGFYTLRYQKTWSNVYRIYAVSCRQNPAPPLALATWGGFELDLGNDRESVVIARKLHASPYRDRNAADRAFCDNLSDYLTGTALYREGKKTAALQYLEACRPYLRETHDLAPGKYPLLLANLADCYYTGGLEYRAAVVYDELIPLFKPDSFENHFFRGLRAICRQDLPGAADHFRAALKLDPANVFAQKALANVEAALKRRD